MKEQNRRARHEEVSAAAYRLLETKGYGGTSMLSIAKAARASNETLYKWYGDKKGLFGQLVADNAAETKQILEAKVAGETDAFEALKVVAPVFLTMLLGDKAISLNRAAAADPSGELGAAISAAGRDVVQPLFEAVMQPLAQGRETSADQLTRWFLGLLVGDTQIKRVIGVTKRPKKAHVDQQVALALDAFAKVVSGR